LLSKDKIEGERRKEEEKRGNCLFPLDLKKSKFKKSIKCIKY
jgi:hypothetical protein